MRSLRMRAVVVLSTVLILAGVTPAAAAGPSIGSGSCVYETATGINSAIGSADWIEANVQTLVDRTVPCSAPLVQALSGWTNVSSPFGMRVHPISGARTMHWGTDYARSGIRGAPILSIADGTVLSSIESYATSGTGNTIVILHANNVRSQYMHMGAKSPLPVGAAVKAGQVVGNVGTTGGSTGPHLHLEIRVNGTLVDPVPFLASAPYLR